MRTVLLILGLLLVPVTLSHAGQHREQAPKPLIQPEHGQLIAIRSASWWAATGTLQRYERRKGSWQSVGAEVPVNLGRRGMAWGRGLHPSGQAGPNKREGDSKSPAGVYALGTAFGIAESLPNGSRGFDYLRATDTNYCVEDTRSEHYNRLVDSREIRPKGWEKWSELVRSDGLFDWALVVRHNNGDVQKGAGSCVFLHIWRGPKQPTAGCTAMAQENIETVLRWLDGEKNPVLVQLPEAVYAEVRADWGLP